MQSAPDLGLFGGLTSRNESTHPLLRSYGADRVVNTTSTPRTITITRRGGSSQGLGIDLAELTPFAGRSYRFEFTGRFTSGSGSHEVVIESVAGTTRRTNLAQSTIATNANFTISYTASAETIAQHRADGITAYRLGGGSRQDLVITGIVITRI
jgi:hypothetical protein